MRSIASQVATQLSVPAIALANPFASIAMCASGTPVYQPPEGEAPYRLVRIALDDGAQPLKFHSGTLAAQGPLHAGEALVFDSTTAHTFRRADWQNALVFRV